MYLAFDESPLSYDIMLEVHAKRRDAMTRQEPRITHQSCFLLHASEEN